MRILFYVFLLASIGAAYWYWVRPILLSKPAFKDLMAKETSWTVILADRFAGIKQKLTGALVVVASSAVALHDLLGPVIAGIDITPLSGKLPSWTWPLILIVITLLLNWFRSLAEKRGDV